VIEVHLNEQPLKNEDLRWLTPFGAITDLSMESTPGPARQLPRFFVFARGKPR
jgi:hypothetical protein